VGVVTSFTIFISLPHVVASLTSSIQQPIPLALSACMLSVAKPGIDAFCNLLGILSKSLSFLAGELLRNPQFLMREEGRGGGSRCVRINNHTNICNQKLSLGVPGVV
jgi:hypothetical protein